MATTARCTAARPRARRGTGRERRPIAIPPGSAGRSAQRKAGSLPLVLRVQMAPHGRSNVSASTRVTLASG